MSLEFRPKPLLPGPDTVGSRAGALSVGAAFGGSVPRERSTQSAERRGRRTAAGIPHRPMPARSRRSGSGRHVPPEQGGALRSCVAPSSRTTPMPAISAVGSGAGPSRSSRAGRSPAVRVCAVVADDANAGHKPAVRAGPSHPPEAGRSPALLRCTTSPINAGVRPAAAYLSRTARIPLLEIRGLIPDRHDRDLREVEAVAAREVLEDQAIFFRGSSASPGRKRARTPRSLFGEGPVVGSDQGTFASAASWIVTGAVSYQSEG